MSASFDLLDTPLPPGVTLLEASAGTGKTYALAALVLRLIGEEDISIGQILVTTYTIPATAELRERIRARLTEAVAAFDGTPAKTPFIAEFARRHADVPAMRSRLAAAVRDFDQAFITTIHGFCQRMLTECAFETRSAPGLELLPDQSALVREVAEDFWRRTFTTHDLAPFALLAGLSPDALARVHSATSTHVTAMIRPPASQFDAACEHLRSLLATLRLEWPGWRDAVRSNYVDAEWAIGDWAKPGYVEAHFELLESLATDAHAPLSAYHAVDVFHPASIEKGRGLGTKRGERKKIPDHPFTRWTDEFHSAVKEFAAVTMARFLDVARSDLAARKEALGLMSFDDLLLRFHAALLLNDAVRNAVRARFRVALVDEFQDTDPIQSAIFGRIFSAEPHRLFLIGDPKQAIFGFRGADLHAYIETRDAVSRRFRLDTNFRSDAPLVRAVNHLFERHPRPFIEDIGFEAVLPGKEESVRPLTVAAHTHPPMRFWFWSSDDPIKPGTADEKLPGIVASEIVRMLGSARLEGSALLPRDCAVLCSTNDQCRSVQAALAMRNVPAVVLSSASVFESDDARELHIVLAALAQPSNEAAIRAALATGLFGCDAARFVALAEDAPAWEAIISAFRELHMLWRERGFIQMFRMLLHSQRVRECLLAQPEGERRLTNLLHLAELLHATAREFHLGPAGLLRWFTTELRDPDPGDERELRLERDDDAVKILTIHKSKGLEWPVVFCPFLWRKSDPLKNQHPLFHDADGSVVLDLGSTDVEAAKVRAAHERLAEHVRLLYVALTRARHECHVVWGQFKGSENSALMWLLEPPESDGAPSPAALHAHAESRTAPMLRRTLEQIAAGHPAMFSVSEIPEEKADRYSLAEPERPPGAARPFTGRIDTSWRVSSFSALSAAHESEERDYDFDARDTAPEDLRGIHAFPRGTRAGVCIHEIFEALDFTQPSSLGKIVPDSLALHGMHTVAHASVITETVLHTLGAPLLEGGALTLGKIPLRQTMREMEFHLPAAMITPQRISEFIMEEVAFEPRRGLLKGFIDLIFEHEGRYHVLDWKSNWLGPTSGHYSPAAITAEIAHHRYDLQWQLYLLALHRHLRARLPGYDPARNLGTVFYVFVRGIDPAHPTTGIHRAEPDIAALERLDRLFKGS